ncbi:hypothetical protein KQX54_021873 [Cotesia glomerata]|uniref:Uncharacterized protein n=1 Tax=Cotesia glomerata TaxID=32391 RepID=A0AAV7IWD8_COTGL|nr:hypothetical protein KQX54_021873 [Cotesia glomerata]
MVQYRTFLGAQLRESIQYEKRINGECRKVASAGARISIHKRYDLKRACPITPSKHGRVLSHILVASSEVHLEWYRTRVIHEPESAQCPERILSAYATFASYTSILSIKKEKKCQRSQYGEKRRCKERVRRSWFPVRSVLSMNSFVDSVQCRGVFSKRLRWR